MIYVKKYNSEMKSEWDYFVNNSKMPMFMFNRDFMEYHKDRFIDASIMFYDDMDLVGVLPASLHDDEVRSHGGLTYGGVICSEKMKQQKMIDCFAAMISFYKSMGISKIIYKSIPYIYHTYSAQEDLYALFLNNATIQKIEPSCTVDLTCPYKMPKGRKAQISRAKRERVHVEETTDFDSFISLENEVLKKYHNTCAVHTGNELASLYKKLPDNIRCFAGYDENKQIIAGG